MKARYAVIRDSIEFKFTKWHENFGEAKQEAVRLCRHERVQFYVVKEVGYCFVEESPIKWRDTDEVS